MFKILQYWEAWGLDNKTVVAPDVSLNLLLLTYIIHVYTLYLLVSSLLCGNVYVTLLKLVHAT